MGEVDLCGGSRGWWGKRVCACSECIKYAIWIDVIEMILLIFDNIYSRHEHKESMKYEARLSVNKL